MTTSLFALTGEARILQARIDSAAEDLFADDPAAVAAATEILEWLITAEAENRQALAAKADAWCWVIESYRATAASRREHADRLRALAEESEHRAEVLQEQLITALQRVDPTATKWDLPEHRISSRRSTAVELDTDLAPEDLPEQFQRVRTTTSADRTALAAALKAGATVPGAQLVERRSWRIG